MKAGGRPRRGQPAATTCNEVIAKMQRLSNGFYSEAFGIGCHPFIEFTGMMNEWLGAARRAAARGVDVVNASTHSGIALEMEPHEGAYLGEKFDCIFGPSLRASPEAMRAFLAKIVDSKGQP